MGMPVAAEKPKHRKRKRWSMREAQIAKLVERGFRRIAFASKAEADAFEDGLAAVTVFAPTSDYEAHQFLPLHLEDKYLVYYKIEEDDGDFGDSYDIDEGGSMLGRRLPDDMPNEWLR